VPFHEPLSCPSRNLVIPLRKLCALPRTLSCPSTNLVIPSTNLVRPATNLVGGGCRALPSTQCARAGRPLDHLWTTEGLDSASQLCVHTGYAKDRGPTRARWRVGDTLEKFAECPNGARPRSRRRQFWWLFTWRYSPPATAPNLLRFGVTRRMRCRRCWQLWSAGLLRGNPALLAGGFGVWFRLSLGLAFFSQFAYTLYFDYLHAPFGELWPSDILVFFWAVPAMMTLFLGPRDQSKGFRWLRLCDFLQVCVLVLSLELSLLFVPSRWLAPQNAMFVRTFHVAVFFFGLLTLSFLVRAAADSVADGTSVLFSAGSFLLLFRSHNQHHPLCHVHGKLSGRERGSICRGH
jgi:hypothetical protein